MKNLRYVWSKLLRKTRGAAIANSSIDKTSKVEPGSAFVNSRMGKHSFCGYDCEILNTHIGNFCSIANYVAIGGAHHPTDWVGMSPVFYAGRDSVKKKFSIFERETDKPTFVGSDVWIGYRAIIVQGVTIGHGAVVGAGAVVTSDVPPFAIVGGVPARVIRYRFAEKMRTRLLESSWWDRPDEVLERCSDSIRDPDIFLEKLDACE